MSKKIEMEWKKQLSKIEYQILREKGTEPPFSGEFWNHKEKGVYKCKGCGAVLFSSETKFASGCGWPSFFDALSRENIEERIDRSHGMVRIEVLCKCCGSHLGHVFNDGPPEKTGLRYCINSLALTFEKADD
ncbi:MAG: peptide-methionine (R)-S-oxide reductase MsrB [Candidatus Heimdallarchaeota archaeon]|nr:peptide-methionine (R)-S-oxide reductase MsrB [Candidatus Heimdallarchaeota archaeon]